MDAGSIGSASHLAAGVERAERLSLTAREHRRLAEVLLRAARSHQPITPLSERYPELTVFDALRIRDMTLRYRIASGERLIGAKAAGTPDEPRYGWLTDGMIHPHPNLECGALSRPAVEAKVALLLGSALDAPVESPVGLMALTERVLPCLEIVDSHYGESEVGPLDAIADNCAAGKIILGTGFGWCPEADLRHVAVALEIHQPSGECRQVLPSRPSYLEMLVWLANVAVEQHVRLESGVILLSPCWGPAVTVNTGARVSADFGAGGGVRCVLSA